MQPWPLPRRQKHLLDLVNGASGATSVGKVAVWYEGNVTYEPVYSIPLELPVYRLANGRTRAAQAERVATEGLPVDFFTADPDSAPALEKQNEILTEMVNEKNLLNHFKKNDQTDPLYVTPKGYVVNGNRRLCAMRTLVAQEEDRYRRFKQVKVVILPTDDEEPIRRVEAHLQIEPDVRADYSWVTLAMMRRGLREIGMSDEAIARLHDTKTSEVKKSIDMLDQAERYLNWANRKGQYSLIAKKMYAFDQLKKNREQTGASAPRVEFATNVSYLLIDDPKGGRLYERIPDLFKNLDEVKEKIKERYPEAPEPGRETGGGDRTLFGGKSSDESEFSDLIATATHPTRKDDVRLLVQDTLEEIDLRERQRRDAEYCLRLITRAHTDLQTAANSFDASSVTDGITKQLNGIDAAVQRIKKWLADNDKA
jgi:hypothetical protein